MTGDHVRKNAVSEDEAVSRLTAQGMRPLEPYPGVTSAPWRMACKRCGRETARPLNRGNTIGCRQCAKRYTEQVVDEILEGSTLSRSGDYMSGRRVPVECSKCQQQFDADIVNYRSQGRVSCRFCAGRQITPEDLKRRIIQSEFEWIGDSPVVVRSQIELRCTKCNRTSVKTLDQLTKGKGCRYCARNAPVDEQTVRAKFLTNGLLPIGPFPGASGKGWRSTCIKCGRTVSPHYSRVRLGTGCAYCSGKRVDPEEATKRMQLLGYEPLVPYPGALKPWRCVCLNCGKESRPTYGSTKNKGSQCKFCNPAGVNLTEPATLYLVKNNELAALKIGITGEGKNRLEQHGRQGWHTLRILELESGQLALSIEQSIKRWIREDLLLPQYLGKVEMPQGGATETFAADEVDWQIVWTRVLELQLLLTSEISNQAP